MNPARALWAGPGARRALAAGGRGAVEFALHPGGYARLGDEWLLLAVPRAPRGPLTLVVAGLEAAPLRPGEAVALEAPPTAGSPRGGAAPPTGWAPPGRGAQPGAGAPPGGEAWADGAAVLRAGGLRVELLGLRAPAAPLSPAPPSRGWRGALEAALDAAPAAPRDFAAGLAALGDGDLGAAADALAGRGEGLTPSGDDVLAGYAARCYADGAPVRFAGERCAPLGLAYLRCAERGELPEPAADVLRAIRAGDAAAARRRSGGLARWGSTSGAAILWGIAA